MKGTTEVSSTFAEAVPAAGSSIPSTHCLPSPPVPTPGPLLDVLTATSAIIKAPPPRNTHRTKEDPKAAIGKTQGASSCPKAL